MVRPRLNRGFDYGKRTMVKLPCFRHGSTMVVYRGTYATQADSCTMVQARRYHIDLVRLVDIPSRRRMRPASSLQLDVPRTHRRAVGDRAFAAAGPTLWNSLPHDITHRVSLASVCRRLKTFLLSMSFLTTFFFLVVLEVST